MPNFNTIALRFGYAESHKVAPLIFQIDALDCSVELDTPKEVWKSFLRFLIAKYKVDNNWANQKECRWCAFQIQPNMKFCPNCGQKNQIRAIKYLDFLGYFLALQREEVDNFGADYYQLEEEEFEVDNWSYNFSWRNISSVLEIPVFAERVLAVEIYLYAKEFEPEFLATLEPKLEPNPLAWRLDDWILREIQNQNGSIFFSSSTAQGK